MDESEKAVMRAAFPAHAFVRILHPLGEAILAIPREQPTPEQKASVELYHGATVRLDGR